MTARLRTLLGASLCAVAMIGRTAAGTAADRTTAVATVNTFITAMEQADLALMMTTFADEATVFMPGEPTSRLDGKTAIHDAFAKLLAVRTGPIVIKPADVAVQALGDVAIVTAHLVRPPTAPGTSRRTFVLRRDGDRWLIVHLHASNIQR
jgi:uncharacterized protein (TIGR02246 family)